MTRLGKALAIAVTAGCFHWAAGAAAQTFYVDAARGDDAASGRSWPEAFATMARGLEAARTAAAAGGFPRVNVAAGDYALSNAWVRFPVRLVGGYPPGGGARDRVVHESRLDAGGGRYVIRFGIEARGSVLDGFLVTGAADVAIEVQGDVLIRNNSVADNPGTGIRAERGAKIERNLVLRNHRNGVWASVISAEGAVDCTTPIRVSDNLVQGCEGFGVLAQDICALDPGWGDGPVVTVKDNRLWDGLRWNAFEVPALLVNGCPIVTNNEVLGTQGPGAGFAPFSFQGGPAISCPVANVEHLTVSGSTGVGVVLYEGFTELRIGRSILWSNAKGDVESPASTLQASQTLSESPLPGPGNISGTDPLLIPGPGGGLRLSQVAAGQAADSPALDAGAIPSIAAGLGDRTTRTDGARDTGLVDLGFHGEPNSFTVLRGVAPDLLLPHLPGVALPVTDAGAAAPPSPGRLFYRVDSDEEILLRRIGADVEIRFRYQEFD